ncbi:MAG: HAMP domain-containing protein [Actinobacteria bacterium]|nr:HAMP domain-containing protein [Actinomycetota bacterium]
MRPFDWTGRSLPEWMRSARVRLAVLYSASLFVIGGLLLAGLYFALSKSIEDEPMSSQFVVVRNPIEPSQPQLVRAQDFERAVTDNALSLLKTYSFLALGVLFVVSLGVGWVVAGRLLAPIDRITDVARRIQATDLSRRISLGGPDDELKRLADTFDSMLARLDAAFVAQRRFIADASHELRNPLAVIRTNLDVVLSDPNTDEISLRDTSAVVRRATERMSKMVDDMLALARLESPQQLDERVDIGEVANEIAEEFTAVAQSHDVELRRSISDGIFVAGDRYALKRALANLAQNALRYSPAESSITIAAGSKDGWVWTAVEDQGPGIAPEHRHQVFERFWRADKSRSRSLGGSGLGLSIVQQVAQAHSGLVKLSSEVGRGSTFVIWIPALGNDGDVETSGVPDLDTSEVPDLDTSEA